MANASPPLYPGARPTNQILAALPPLEFDRIADHLERVHLEPREILYDVNRPIEYLHFPETVVASIIGVMSDGTAVETATVGGEGMIGMPVFHGTDRSSNQALCQVQGDSFRLPTEVFRNEIDHLPTLTHMLHRYTQALFTLVAQSSACNRVHTMKQRCARWLLHTHDRVGRSRGTDEFALTQQFLSQMIGVRRATVTEAMSALQGSGAISYEMGRITIRDRIRLEAAACECYSIVVSEFERLLPNGRSVANPLDGLKLSDGGSSTAGEAIAEGDRDF